LYTFNTDAIAFSLNIFDLLFVESMNTELTETQTINCSVLSFQHLPTQRKYVGHALEQLVKASFQHFCNTITYKHFITSVVLIVLCGHKFKLWK
jgi:hypothetical protein